MRTRLNDWILVVWNDGPPTVGLVVINHRSTKEAKVYFPGSKEFDWIDYDQIKKVLGSIEVPAVPDELKSLRLSLKQQ